MLTYHKTTEEEKEIITAWQYAGQYAIYNTTPYAEQKKQGVAAVYVGEELDVRLELGDRIVGLFGGQVSGVVDARTTDKHQVGALMTLVNKGGKADE